MDREVLNKIQKARPNLKQSSLKSYERNMKKLFKLLKLDEKSNINDLKWILMVDDIILSLDKTPNASKRAYFATLIVFLQVNFNLQFGIIFFSVLLSKYIFFKVINRESYRFRYAYILKIIFIVT